MRLRGAVIIVLIGLGFQCVAQKAANSPTVQQEKVNEKLPQFPGGDAAFYAYLDLHVLLPEGFDGKKFMKESKSQFVPISVGFTIDAEGSITDVKVIDGACEALDKKAKEIVENMPKWVPGYQDGSPIKVQYAIPVRFNLM